MRNIPLQPAASDIVSNMRNIPALAALGDELLSSVVRMSTLRRYDAGETVIEEGANDSWLYFLVLGELVVEHQGVEVCRLTSFGELFGEMGLIDGSPRTATVRAHIPSVCLALDASLFNSMPETKRAALKAALNEVILANMAERLRKANDLLAGRKE